MAESDPSHLLEMHLWDLDYKIDCSKASRILGVRFREIKVSLYDMAEKMIEMGVIPDLRGKTT